MRQAQIDWKRTILTGARQLIDDTKNRGMTAPLTAIILFIACFAIGCGGSSGGGGSSQSFQVDETTIAKVEAAFKNHTLTCHQLVETYLERIALFNHSGPAINPIIDTNPDALAIADSLDAAFKQSGPVGPLHCVPTLLKDNNNTGDLLPTRAGSLTMDDFTASADAFAIAKLRAAGALILGKTNMDEWAFGGSGYSSRGGQTLNPYRLDRVPGGSSGGSAVAMSANLGLISTGTDTGGSIRIPSAFDGVVGIKPTRGLVGRSGIVPGSHYTDVIGPITRTVADAATMLGPMTGIDPDDPDSAASAGHSFADYTQFLDRDGLNGAHISVFQSIDGTPLSGDNADVDATLQHVLSVIQQRGATIVAPTDLNTNLDDNDFQILADDLVTGQFGTDVAQYFLNFAPTAPVQSVADIVAASENLGSNVVKNLDQLQGTDRPPPTPEQLAAALAIQQTLTDAINDAMDSAGADALVFPTILCPATPLGGVAKDDGYQCKEADPLPLPFGKVYGILVTPIASLSGCPEITVPAGFTKDGLPIAVSFFGRAWSEPTLVRLAYAFEQATHARRPPKFLPQPN